MVGCCSEGEEIKAWQAAFGKRDPLAEQNMCFLAEDLLAEDKCANAGTGAELSEER